MALWAWLFALTTGVANACLVPTHASHTEHEEHQHTPAPHGHGDHEAARRVQWASAEHADPEHPGLANCLKFCDDQSSALSKKGGAEFDQALVSVPVVAVRAQAAHVTDALARLSLDPPGAQGPPLVIRLLRLAL